MSSRALFLTRLHTYTAMVLVVGSLASFSGCKTPWGARSTTFINPQELLTTLNAEFPQGAPMAVARVKMEELGFECAMVTDGSFLYQGRDGEGRREKRTRENIDFIECKRDIKKGQFVTYFESVALVIENEMVVDVLYEMDSLGP